MPATPASRSTVHEAADSSIHPGTLDSCAPCHGVTCYWQVRLPATGMQPSGQLLWDGYDAGDAYALQDEHPRSVIVREDWKDGRLLRTEQEYPQPA